MVKTDLNKVKASLAWLAIMTMCFLSQPWIAEVAASPGFVVSPHGVGGITPGSKHEDLVKLFGAKNVEACEIAVSEGETAPGARVYPNSKNELLIQWKAEGTPEQITIAKPGTEWKTREGITIGTSLAEVQRLNGKPFRLTGFGWFYGGMVDSWQGGKLPENLSLSFEEPSGLSPAEASQVVGEMKLNSNHPILEKKGQGLKVKLFSIGWPEKKHASVAKKSCPPSQHAKIPSIQDRSYHEARKALLEAGWKPYRSKPAQPSREDPDIAYGNGALFWKKGYLEVESCAGTGLAPCAFLFEDSAGNRLRVTTAGEEAPEQGAYAMVQGFRFLCEP